jgi:hypothetical protein
MYVYLHIYIYIYFRLRVLDFATDAARFICKEVPLVWGNSQSSFLSCHGRPVLVLWYAAQGFELGR